MTIAVTGASGFIGRALLEQLRRKGKSVVALTRRRLPDLSGFTQVDCYRQAPDADTLVHLAEEGDVAQAERAGDAHVARVTSLVNRLLEKGYRRVIYASSGAVYGDRSFSARKPRDAIDSSGFYVRAKLAAEDAVLEHFGGVVVRLANVIGPGMAQSSVLAEILKQIPGTGPIMVRDGAVVRDFVSVKDIAAGIAAVASGTRTGCFNLGSGVGTSIAELARISLTIAGQQGREVISTAPLNHRSFLVLDSDETEKAFGWRPLVPLRDAVAASMGR